eukprot:8614252-Ditylum_brightwellii.AAC.1
MLAPPRHRWLWLQALFPLLAASVHVASAATLSCPLPGSPYLSIGLPPFTGSATASLSLSTSPPPGYDGDISSFLCLLSLRTPSLSAGGTHIRKPVARTYAGRKWEVQG